MSDVQEFLFKRTPGERGQEAEEAAHRWLLQLENVRHVMRAAELWSGEGYPRTLLEDGGVETILAPDFLVTLDTGFQRWMEVKSTFRINEWHLTQYHRLAAAQPWRPFRVHFFIDQGGGEWHIYHATLGKITFSNYHYEAASPYYNVDMSSLTGPVVYKEAL